MDIFVADIGLSSSISNPRPIVGENINIILTTINNGPDDATNVEVQYTIPDGLEFVSALSSSGTVDETWG